MDKQVRKRNLLIYFTAISAGILLISNLAATKLWDLFGIPVDGGVISFPISYILGDIIIEFYGHKTAKHIILGSLLVNIIAALTFWIVIALPPFAGTEGMQESIANVLGFIGSLTAYLFSQFSNNYIFEKIKQKTGQKLFIVRALTSSFVAHFFDTLVFETVAFLGVLAFSDFLNQAIFAYLIGIGIEIVLSPVEIVIVKQLRKYIPAHKVEIAKSTEEASEK